MSSTPVIVTSKTKCARPGCGHPKGIHDNITTSCFAVILTNPYRDENADSLFWDETDCPCPAFVAPTTTP